MSELISNIALNCFDNKPYHLRHPSIEDLADLVALEELCWSANLRVDANELQRRIVDFPQGQFVLGLEGKILGAIYSQRIDNAQLLDDQTCTEVPSLHTESGVVVQLLAVNILPELQNQGLGDQLLEFMLQYCSRIDGVEKIVAVTLCRNYPDYSPMPIAEYIQQKNDSGLLVDPLLRFHQIHGAKIEKLLPGYRPKDLENQTCGVLVSYDIHHRQRFDGATVEKNPQTKVKLAEDIDEVVASCVRKVMQQKQSFDVQRALMEMGIESLELLELRYLLQKKLGVEIDPNFFFKYGTAAAIAGYFKGETTEKHQEVSDLLPEPEAIKTDAGFSKAQLENGVAIIGMACRFPGDADSPHQYWSLLHNGIDGITEVPPTRWDIEQYYHPEKNQPGKIASRYGGFLTEVDKFEPDFFRISAREALYMDPQQRLLLEEHWKALEDAGINPESLSGTETGIFVGIAFHDYERLQDKYYSEQDLNIYFATGNSTAIGAGRLSYFFQLNGPSITVDTACSSSLSAVHLACQSIRNGECELALASGVNLLLSPELSISFSQAGMLSPDGRCKTFDAAANGYVRSEGCGVVVLKSLKQAIADNDRILAVIRGTAINQDGASNGLTAPNQSAQEAVLKRALSVAGVSANQISYVEAHGTGTSLGDPVEIKAIEAVYGKDRSSARPLMIGSVKTNIGHTEAAAGIAGLIKVVLLLQNQYIPPHLHWKELNPYISLAEIPGVIPTEGKVWEQYEGDKTRVAAVSSFGFSGTNAHAIVEEAEGRRQNPPLTPPRRGTGGRRQEAEGRRQAQPYLLTVSAKKEQALSELVSSYQHHLETNPELELADVCYTANSGRAHFNHRLAIIATNPQQLAKKLRQYQAGEEESGVFSGQLSHSSSPAKVAFLFTGQGSQYVQMGRQLYQTQPVFRQVLDQCDQLLRPYLEHPLLEVLYPQDTPNSNSSLLDQTAYTQPTLFALEYALCKLWESWGIQPQVVMGHSVGEYVAATVAGVLSLEDGLKLIALRGKLMQQLPSGGKMVSVMASESQVKDAIASHTNQVTIAAINGPESVVISGEAGGIEAIVKKLESKSIKTKQLQVSHAFHSPLMTPMLAEFAAVAKQITYHQPQIPVISNVTGTIADNSIATADYWVEHVVKPVRFVAGIKTLAEQDIGILLEIGPKPVLLGMGRECLIGSKKIWLPSLRPGKPDWLQMLQSLGQLYVQGVKVDWLGFYQDSAPQKVVLPTYTWQRKRYWISDLQQYKNKGKNGKVAPENKNKGKNSIATNNSSGSKILPGIKESKQPQIKVSEQLPIKASEQDDRTTAINIQKSDALDIQQQQKRLSNPASLSFSKTTVAKQQPAKRELTQLRVPLTPEEPAQLTQAYLEAEKITQDLGKALHQDILINQEPIKEPTTMNREQVEQLKQEYEEKGYCQIQKLFDFSAIKTIEKNLEKAKQESQISKEKVTLKLGGIDDIDTNDHAYDLVKYDFVSSFIQEKLALLNYITGKNLMIMHNALFSVEPNHKGLPWHVGVGSFSFTKTEDFGASIWIPLDKITKEYRGGMQYVSTKIFPGQFYYSVFDLHLKNNIRWDESQGDLNEYVGNANTIYNKITEDVIDYTIQDGYEEHEYDLGDAFFFNKYVLHQSVPLKPGLHKLRRAFVIRLVDYDTRVDEERLGLFSKYSQLHSRYYKTLPRYNKDSVLVMVSRAVQKGLKSPYLRDISHVQQTLAERMAAGTISFEETPSISSVPQTQQPRRSLQPLSQPQVNQVNLSQIKQILKQQLAEALYTDESEIAEDQKFVDLGLDSIVGVEWTTTINQAYNLNLKATKLYDYPTLLELTEYIAQILSTQSAKPQVSQLPVKTLPPLPTTQINLSEIKQVLKQQLAEALYTDESEIAEDQKFVDLGLDSIVGVEWTTTINQTYNLNLKATKLYDYPTLLELTEYIAQILSTQGTKPINSSSQTQQPLKTLQPLPTPQVNQVNLSQIKQVLKQQLAEALYTEESEIAEDQKFVDLGLDSIVGVEWTTTINQTYNLNLKATKLYDYPTLLELAPYIAQEISSTGGSKFPQTNGSDFQGSAPNNGSPKEQMDPKLRLREILNKVATKELTAQEANKLVQQLKQQVRS
ncbi:MAG: GNAT family N-acetyltransferase [Symploca sp. SIO1C2]|nr:GNAT family N-acetyltransferase [Symploca sp. SIO1C2]